MAIASTKFIMLGVKLYVIEVKKLDFCIHVKKYLLKSPNLFEQKCGQQLTAAMAARCWAVFGGKFKQHIKQHRKGKE